MSLELLYQTPSTLSAMAEVNFNQYHLIFHYTSIGLRSLWLYLAMLELVSPRQVTRLPFVCDLLLLLA